MQCPTKCPKSGGPSALKLLVKVALVLIALALLGLEPPPNPARQGTGHSADAKGVFQGAHQVLGGCLVQDLRPVHAHPARESTKR